MIHTILSNSHTQVVAAIQFIDYNIFVFQAINQLRNASQTGLVVEKEENIVYSICDSGIVVFICVAN